MKRARRGYILLQALVVVACLVALMAVLAANQRASLRDVQDKMRTRRAEIAARSAVARALAVLEETTSTSAATTTSSTSSTNGTNSNLVTLNDDWATVGDNGNQSFNLGDSTFRMQIVDAGSLLNINTATETQLDQLPLTQEQIDCLLDWREASTQPRSDGAKNEYYNGLQEPYNARLGNLTSITELLLIKNWTAQVLYTNEVNTSGAITLPTDPQGNSLPLISILTTDGGAPNTTASGTARTNLNRTGLTGSVFLQMGLTEPLADQLAARGPYTSFQSLLTQPGVTTAIATRLLNSATFSGGTRMTGKININTTTAAVLETNPLITTDIATAIVAQQSTGFTGLGDLTTISGLTTLNTLAQVADNFAVGSDTWIVRAYGECNGVGVAFEVTVLLANGRAQPQSWRRINTTGIPTWWGWQTDTTDTVDMEITQ